MPGVRYLVLLGVGLGLAAPLSLSSASAQTYPSQDVHLICGYPAGSGADIIVRYYAEKLRAIAGRTVLVDNRTGALGNIATEYVARAKPDGYTVYLTGAGVLAASMVASRLIAATACSSLATSTGGFLNKYMLAARTPPPVR